MNVIITGSSRGIGYAIAEVFAAQSANLFLCSKQEALISKAAEELKKKFPHAGIHAQAHDLSKKEEAVAFGKWCVSMGIPDILVNNAGHFAPGGVHDEPEGLLESQVATNLYSAYHLTRTVLPSMMKLQETQRTGHIFNICSIASLHAYRNGGAYSISKFALHGFSKNLREELKPYHIKVTSVFPGAVMTDSWKGFDNSRQRIMPAVDIANMIYAASQLSPATCVEDLVIRPQLGDL
jgi:short-subunit dehydrogenase